jgi:hypothetical protein
MTINMSSKRLRLKVFVDHHKTTFMHQKELIFCREWTFAFA